MIALFATLLAVVTTPYAPVSYACDGSTAAFTVNFPYLSSSDLTVTSTTAGGVVTTLSLTTDFTTNVVSTTSTAVLTILVPATKCPSGSTLKISRTMACTQPQVFRQQTSFDPRLVESASDRVLMCAQQVQAQVASTQNVSFPGNNTFVGLQTFTSGNAIDGPVMLTPQAADPTTPANGEVWVNSTTNLLKARINGVSTTYTVVGSNPLLGANTAAAQSIASNATPSIVVYGTVEIDTDSGYNAGTGRYTIPAGKGGHYEIVAQITWGAAPGSSTTSPVLSIFKNASVVKDVAVPDNLAFEPMQLTTILNLAAGDIIDVRLSQQTGLAVALQGIATRNYLSIKRLSD